MTDEVGSEVLSVFGYGVPRVAQLEDFLDLVVGWICHCLRIGDRSVIGCLSNLCLGLGLERDVRRGFEEGYAHLSYFMF